MRQDFDLASSTYDEEFTNTHIGRSQRNKVWMYLDQFLENRKSLNILELNCGTGEDAVHMAKLKHRVLATDISEEMLNKGKKKISDSKNLNIEFQKLNINDLGQFKTEKRFDLIFSNFGGMNCLSQEQLEKFSLNAKELLNPNGSLILVIMPNFCLWESLYFSSKLRLEQIFRRRKPSVLANVSGVQVRTRYYSPKKIFAILSDNFIQIRLKPVGLFIPPSFLETFIQKHTMFFKTLQFFENKLSGLSIQSYLADHYYIELEAK